LHTLHTFFTPPPPPQPPAASYRERTYTHTHILRTPSYPLPDTLPHYLCTQTDMTTFFYQQPAIGFLWTPSHPSLQMDLLGRGSPPFPPCLPLTLPLLAPHTPATASTSWTALPGGALPFQCTVHSPAGLPCPPPQLSSHLLVALLKLHMVCCPPAPPSSTLLYIPTYTTPHTHTHYIPFLLFHLMTCCLHTFPFGLFKTDSIVPWDRHHTTPHPHTCPHPYRLHITPLPHCITHTHLYPCTHGVWAYIYALHRFTVHCLPFTCCTFLLARYQFCTYPPPCTHHTGTHTILHV